MSANTKLVTYYQNVRGLRTKCLEFFNNILYNDYDLIIITETWLQDDILNYELCDSRYEVLRCDRDLLKSNMSTGGGVMACIKREYNAVISLSCPSASYELMCVTIPAKSFNNNINLHLFVGYVSPRKVKTTSALADMMIKIKSFINTRQNDHFILIGDFNMSSLKWNSDGVSLPLSVVGAESSVNKFLDFAEEAGCCGFKQYNLIANRYNNVLDLCFSTLPLTITPIINPILPIDICHPPIHVDILDLFTKPLINAQSERIIFSKGNYDEINSFFNKIDWNSLFLARTMDEAVEIFYSKVYDSIRLFIPKKVVSKHNYPIWYSPALIKIIREKSKVHKKWKRWSNPRDYDEFALLRKRQQRVQGVCFHKFTKHSQKMIRFSPKYFWTYVKSKRGGSSYPSEFILGNNKYTGGANICTAFNSFFKSVFITPSSSSSTSTPANSTSSVSIDGIGCVVVDSKMVRKLLVALDRGKGPGCDRVPPVFLIKCADSLATPITLLFKKSLESMVFPTIWKRANILPIHKKGTKSSIENYRPISILNTISKVFEKIIYSHIYPVITHGITSAQHGFLKSRSTVSNLSVFSNYVINEMENGGQVDVVYTDFEKAFDRVDHDILLEKLLALGIHGDLLRWVHSYLSNRSQAVIVGGFKSDYILVPSGVPQGSHLGPLFYNVYIHDIYTSLHSSRHLLYADDKKVFLSVRSFTDCKLIQDDLDNLYAYYTRNNITVNIKKCQCISYTHKRAPFVFQYNFNGVAIDRVVQVRDLGVLMDNKMSFVPHIDYMVSKAFRSLGFVMRTCKPFYDLQCINIVYFAYVRSVLEYASPIWNPIYNVHKKHIESIQKKYTKFLSFKFKNSTDSYDDCCQRFNLNSLHNRRTISDMILLFDILHNRMDSPDLLTGIGFSVPCCRTRHTRLFGIPNHSTNYGLNAVLTRLCRTYNKNFNDIDLFNESRRTYRDLISKEIDGWNDAQMHT